MIPVSKTETYSNHNNLVQVKRVNIHINGSE